LDRSVFFATFALPPDQFQRPTRYIDRQTMTLASVVLILLVLVVRPMAADPTSCAAGGSCATVDDTSTLQSKLQFQRQGKISRFAAKANGDDQNVDIGAMIVEPRCHIALPLVVHNMRKRLPSLPIQLFYSDNNADCVQAWFSFEKNITLTKLDNSFFLGTQSNRDISWLFSNYKFWEKVLHDKVLVFQQDSWVCAGAEAKLNNFLRYDFIGAPWPDGKVPGGCDGVGNGGFSLRTVKVMQAISKKFGQSSKAEDVYFCRHLRGWQGVVMPDVNSSGHFSAEMYDGSQDHAPLGTHQAARWAWFNTSEGVALQKNCPGLNLLHTADVQAKSYLNAHQDAVRVGNQILQQARF